MSAHDFSSKHSYDTPDDCNKNAKENQTQTDRFYPDPFGLLHGTAMRATSQLNR